MEQNNLQRIFDNEIRALGGYENAVKIILAESNIVYECDKSSCYFCYIRNIKPRLAYEPKPIFATLATCKNKSWLPEEKEILFKNISTHRVALAKLLPRHSIHAIDTYKYKMSKEFGIKLPGRWASIYRS